MLNRLVRSARQFDAADGELPQRCDQRVDVLAGVVERQRRADGAFVAEAAHDRLGAVVTRAHGDPFVVERLADLLGR